jgi:para-aminobenzoate synthetase/4-amino-4-deoxychorismate lyase
LLSGKFHLSPEFEWFGTPLDLYARLRQRQPVRYGGFVGDAAGGIVSLSPELFLERMVSGCARGR